MPAMGFPEDFDDRLAQEMREGVRDGFRSHLRWDKRLDWTEGQAQAVRIGYPVPVGDLYGRSAHHGVLARQLGQRLAANARYRLLHARHVDREGFLSASLEAGIDPVDLRSIERNLLDDGEPVQDLIGAVEDAIDELSPTGSEVLVFFPSGTEFHDMIRIGGQPIGQYLRQTVDPQIELVRSWHLGDRFLVLDTGRAGIVGPEEGLEPQWGQMRTVEDEPNFVLPVSVRLEPHVEGRATVSFPFVSDEIADEGS